MAARQFGSLTCGSSEIGTVRSVRNRKEPAAKLKKPTRTSPVVFSGFQGFITRLYKAADAVAIDPKVPIVWGVVIGTDWAGFFQAQIIRNRNIHIQPS